MALLNDDLSVWELGFRWTENDPDRLWLRIPLPVRDNFRTLMDAILSGHLQCLTISLDKRGDDVESPHFFYIRDDLDAVRECIYGVRFNRKLLKWARIDRLDFMDWCEGREIRLPEFWFPPGWSISYVWPENRRVVQPKGEDPKPDEHEAKVLGERPSPEEAAGESGGDERLRNEKLRPYQLRRIVCQEIAKNLWKKDASITITAMVKHEAIQELGGGQYNEDVVVRRWLAEVAPPEVKARRGRPRKNPPPEE